jgi:hypothetical protein
MLTLKQKLDLAKQEEAIRFEGARSTVVEEPKKKKAAPKKEKVAKPKTIKTKKNG